MTDAESNETKIAVLTTRTDHLEALIKWCIGIGGINMLLIVITLIELVTA